MEDRNLVLIFLTMIILKENSGRNNHNAPKLIEKYKDLAREALSNGDKILSENYLQHADHFTRVLNERESYRREKNLELKSGENELKTNEPSENNEVSKNDLNENSTINSNVESSVEAS